MIGLAGSNPFLAEFQQQTGVNLLTDIAQNLGGEMTVAIDGPLLPTPSWKVAIEVDNPARMEWAIEQAASAAATIIRTCRSPSPRAVERAHLLRPHFAENRLYDRLHVYRRLPASGTVARAASERHCDARLGTYAAAHSAAFRAQLPQDGHTNFSALMYYNMGTTVGPIIDQLKAGGLITPEQKKSIALLATNREPGLVYAYGEPDRIFGRQPQRIFRAGTRHAGRIECEGRIGVCPRCCRRF